MDPSFCKTIPVSTTVTILITAHQFNDNRDNKKIEDLKCLNIPLVPLLALVISCKKL
jgi:hypothetical protein